MGKYRINRPITFAILLMTFVLSSCNDWLSIAPENDLIKEKFWTKREDVDGALAATYNAFRNAALQSFILGEVRADMVTFGDQFGNYQSIAGSDINPTNSAVNWQNYYKAINLANTLMFYNKQVFEKDKTFTQKMMDGVDAEALFIRSLSYFYLVRLWKEVPVVLEPSISDTSALFLSKSSEKVVINQIINDLLKAKDMAYTTEFRNDAVHPKYFNGRANKYAIMALLADVYLWDQQYQNAANYCDSITNTNLFSLEPYDTWFSLYNPGNSAKESIFEIQFDDNLESQENPMYYNLIVGSGSTQMRPSVYYSSIFTKEDLRTCGVFGSIWKYAGVNLNSTVPRTSSQRDANIIYYRYADILMIKAEALTELNRLSEANELVRQVAERAGMVHVEIIVKEDLRKAVLNERAREFVIEGKRWFDILRAAKRNRFEKKQIIIDMILAKASDVKMQAVLKTKVYDTMSYYLPIPEHELRYNPNLVQNPYYDR